MLEGAIIGAVVGLIVAVVTLLKRGSLRKKVLAALQEQGADAALALLDKRVPAAQKIALSKILDQRDRMAALGVLGATERARAELAEHSGALTAVVQVGAMGWLGVALRADDPAPAAAELDALATRMEAEGGRTMKLVKTKTRALAQLAAALSDSAGAGSSLDGDTRRTLDTLANDGGFVQVVVWQALRRALAAAGDARGEEVFASRVRSITRAFEK